MSQEITSSPNRVRIGMIRSTSQKTHLLRQLTRSMIQSIGLSSKHQKATVERKGPPVMPGRMETTEKMGLTDDVVNEARLARQDRKVLAESQEALVLLVQTAKMANLGKMDNVGILAQQVIMASMAEMARMVTVVVLVQQVSP